MFVFQITDLTCCQVGALSGAEFFTNGCHDLAGLGRAVISRVADGSGRCSLPSLKQLARALIEVSVADAEIASTLSIPDRCNEGKTARLGVY